MNMSLYIAGPMSGYPRYNYDTFEEAATSLREAGYAVLSPHELDENLDLRDFDPDVPGSFTIEHRHKAMRQDLDIVLNVADAVALLPGWEQSEGARLEVAVAEAIGKRARPVWTWLTEARLREALRRAYR